MQTNNKLVFQEKIDIQEATKRLIEIKAIFTEKLKTDKLYAVIYANNKGIIMHSLSPATFLTVDSFFIIKDKTLSEKVLQGYIKRQEVIKIGGFLIRHDFISAIKNVLYYIYDDFLEYKKLDIKAVPQFEFNNKIASMYSLNEEYLYKENVYQFFDRLFDIKEGLHKSNHYFCFKANNGIIQRHSENMFIALSDTKEKALEKIHIMDNFVKYNDGAITSSIYNIVNNMLKNKPIEYILWR